ILALMVLSSSAVTSEPTISLPRTESKTPLFPMDIFPPSEASLTTAYLRSEVMCAELLIIKDLVLMKVRMIRIEFVSYLAYKETFFFFVICLHDFRKNNYFITKKFTIMIKSLFILALT